MLLGNYSTLLRGPVFNPTGGGSAKALSQFTPSGRSRNRFMVDGTTTCNNWYSVPQGNTPPSSWIIAQRAGAIKARLTGWGTDSIALVGGKNAEILIDGTGTLTAFASLVASFGASLTGTGALNADLAAIAALSVSMDGVASVSASANGIGWMLSNPAGSSSLSVGSYATGALECSISPFTALSPQGLAEAVWQHADAQQVATRLAEAWGRLGLDLNAPLITGQTSITFGAIVLALTGNETETTVTRQP